MKIHCQSCGNNSRFTIQLWTRVTFKFDEDGTVSILHVKQIESLEEKLTDQGKKSFSLVCKECGDFVEIDFNEYESAETTDNQKKALEDL